MYTVPGGHVGKREIPENPCTQFRVDTWEKEKFLKTHVHIPRQIHGIIER